MEKFLKDILPGGEFQGVEPSHSRLMKAVRGKGNRTTEEKFEKALILSGVPDWEMQSRSVPGRPDFFFPKERIAVFLDGCFWHGCGRCGHIPKKNKEFWAAKISRNKERDKNTDAIIRRHGISVLRFWEHQIRDELDDCISKLLRRIQKRRQKGVAKGGGYL
ncbi:MAG: very short patch repair endonuclease [Syntrophobacteraceae bacterium]|nr:very short patch repair endonuclease [Syntrophobacteraceae bacterium]